VSDALWRSVFGADPRALYKNYLLQGESYTLTGVMPPGFDFPKGCGIWLPISTLGETGLRDRVSHGYHVLGRLRSGANLSQAEAQIETILSSWFASASYSPLPWQNGDASSPFR